jgi:serine/threonine protein kinase
VGSRYQLERVIGHGRMGTVWLAADEVLQRPVAVRLTGEDANDDCLARFTDEARSGAGLWHSNLVQIYDFGIAEGRAFLVMEYLPGGSLRDRLAQSGVSADQLRRLACDLLSALAYLHSRGRRHGGVDAAHVQLDGDGRAHLSGFGTTLFGVPGSSADDLLALGRLLAEAPCPRGDDPVLDELIGKLRESPSGPGRLTADQALEALRDCIDQAGQATQEFDVLSMLAEEVSAVADAVAGERRRTPRWAPQRVLTAIGL